MKIIKEFLQVLQEKRKVTSKNRRSMDHQTLQQPEKGNRKKMRAHSQSDVYMQSCEAELATTRAMN